MKKQKGFTLIELLVVVAAIALLVAIMIPSLKMARNHTKAVVCQSNLRQWGTTLSISAGENDGRLNFNIANFIKLLRGPQFIEGTSNLSAKGITLCPMANQRTRNITGVSTLTASQLGFSFGTKSYPWEIHYPEPAFLGSYGFSSYIIFNKIVINSYSSIGFRKYQPLYDPNTLNVNIYTMKNTGSIPIFLDCGEPLGSIAPEQRTTVGGPPGPPAGINEPPVTEVYDKRTSFCIDRHNGGINSLFLDCSVRKVGLKELWTLKWNDSFDTANKWTKAGGVKPEDWPEWMRGFKDY